MQVARMALEPELIVNLREPVKLLLINIKSSGSRARELDEDEINGNRREL
ncbi:hypothetical protein RvY_01387 [Ramazzottius varieornatus]|uniref:Uncharacterized protein n=1 Tax=Ramazzottius varieornatus TaxID=947166 RepID=A0A1D1UG58_RAMVA|nr:hypothetical protein RvY_01387 [Ramazzottius varieornatus]